MVTVSISETYDLHTVVNKMTLIGIHTPKKELIQKTYPGLCMNYKYFRIKSVDVALSTAQTLPLGVNEIGLDANMIRPQDMMNPILYKAVSNDSWSTLEARIYGIVDSGGSIVGNVAEVASNNVTPEADEHNIYYSLLSNRDGFKVAHPQNGLAMKGLRPIVFQKLYTTGENGPDNADNASALRVANNTTMTPYTLPDYRMRGRPVPMPRMNTSVITGVINTRSPANGVYDGGMHGTLNAQGQMPSIPPVYLGAIVLPPVTATTGILYYRMVTRVWIEFTDVRPLTDTMAFATMTDYGSVVYHTDYVEQSKVMDASTDLVDVKNAEIEKIMEGR